MDLNWRKVSNTTGDHGHFREGHTLTYIRHLDSLLLYGGVSNPRLNAVYLYSISKRSKTQKTTSGRFRQQKVASLAIVVIIQLSMTVIACSK